MTRAAVLGRPIEHSLSPILHRAAYAALGLDWSYEALDCGVAELAAVLAARPDWAGFSCTMPLKRAVLELATEVDERAAVVGAANTLTPLPAGGWRAWSTDVDGIRGALDGLGAPAASATVLGAGGTAQNALAALVALGAERVDVLVRDPARTAEVRATGERLGLLVSVSALDVASPALDAQVLISTLPRGAADQLAPRAWRSSQVLLDAVYDPWPTALAQAFAAHRATVVSGARMLLWQAAAQVALMTGRPAPVEAMRSALLAARPDCGA